MTTRKHDDSITEVNKQGGLIKKPKVVIYYNAGKGFIDRSDQMSSYGNPFRHSLK